MSSLDFTKDVAIIVGGLVALTTFLTGILEYSRQSHLRRAEQFVQMRRRFLETPLFRDILNLLPTDDPTLKTMSIQDRRNFVGFLEEVALMMNSRMIRQEVASYMFGYYVLLTDQSLNLWEGLDKESRYWTLFRGFAADMKAAKSTNPPPPHQVRI